MNNNNDARDKYVSDLMNSRTKEEIYAKLEEYEKLNYQGYVLKKKNLPDHFSLRELLHKAGVTDYQLDISYKKTDKIKYRKLEKEAIHSHLTILAGHLARNFKKDNDGKSTVKVKNKTTHNDILDGKKGGTCNLYPIGYLNDVIQYLDDNPINTWKNYKKIDIKAEIICTCGKTIKQVNQKKHLSTKLHANNLKKLNLIK